MWKQNVTSSQNISRSVLEHVTSVTSVTSATSATSRSQLTRNHWCLISSLVLQSSKSEKTFGGNRDRSSEKVQIRSSLFKHARLSQTRPCRLLLTFRLSELLPQSLRDVSSAHFSVWNWSGSRTTERSLVLLHIHSQWSPERTVRRSLTTSVLLNHRHFRSACTTCVTVTSHVSESSQRPLLNTAWNHWRPSRRSCFKPKHDLIWTVS